MAAQWCRNSPGQATLPVLKTRENPRGTASHVRASGGSKRRRAGPTELKLPPNNEYRRVIQMMTTSRTRSAVGSILIATFGLCMLAPAHAEVCGGSLGKNAWQRPLDYRLAVRRTGAQGQGNPAVVRR